jgi:SPP1 family predicted phage head-tail adaptor
VNAGALRNRVTLERSGDPSNWGVTAAWSTFATVWAKVEPVSGREYVEGRLIQSELTHKVTIRYLSGVKADMRVNFEGRYLKIFAVRNVGERNRELELDCTELT